MRRGVVTQVNEMWERERGRQWLMRRRTKCKRRQRRREREREREREGVRDR